MANGTTTAPLPALGGRSTANDRLKRSFGSWFWGALTIAAIVHFLFLAFWPNMELADYGMSTTEIQQIEIPPEVEIPPPPEEIPRPAVPVLSTNIDITEEITIQEVTFAANPIENLPPPPTGSTVGVGDEPTFTPFEVRPELRNRAEVGRVLERNYPSTLRDAGIGGTVQLWIFINEQGQVQRTRVNQSSGYPQLDSAAEAVAREMRFSPALNRDQRVPVWIQIPVTFQVR
jgi:periplasmic protein TonB